MIDNQIEALIFDLGGVIINLDISKTIHQLQALSTLSQEELTREYWQHEGFHQFEKGLISSAQFRDFLRDFLKTSSNDEVLDNAWNAMILDIPRQRLELLHQLKDRYQLFLLSNTNDIHLDRVHEVFLPRQEESLNDYFIHAYYSNHLGMRKPDREIYEQVLADQQLVPEKTLFLDDNTHNIEGAKSLGIQTIQVNDPQQLNTIFNV